MSKKSARKGIRTWLAILLAVSPCGVGQVGAETGEIARGRGDNRPRQPQAVVDAAGVIHVAYGAGDLIYYCRSTPGAGQFTKPVALPSLGVISLGMRRGPRLCVGPAGICVTAVGGAKGKGRDGDVLAFTSADGQQWQGAIRVNDVADSAREGLHAMAAGPDGSICCAWLDLRNRTTEIHAATSADGGRTWNANTPVYKSPDGSVCECCHPSVACDPQGNALVMWRNSLQGQRDMYYAISRDAGASFGPARKLGVGGWKLNACPMDGGAIGVGPDGKYAAVWRRERDVFLSVAGRDEELLLGMGEQPWLATAVSGTYVVWQAKKFATAYWRGPSSPDTQVLADNANDPVIAVAANGRGPVVAVWEAEIEGDNVLQFSILHRE